MSGDSVLARELTSLREELSASRRERLARGAARAAAVDETSQASTQPTVGAAEPAVEGDLRDLVDAFKEFAEEAERNASEHPTATAIAALALGILIGRLLGRR